MDIAEIINGYYSNYNEDARLTSRYGAIEFFTTLRYIEKYLKPGMHVLEIGAGTGRYSHTLARLDYAVDAVELVAHNIEIFKANTQPGENISITQGNALNLSDFADETYDITLVLGPMYHLYTPEDERQAITEALRVTKTGGIVFVAYVMTDLALVNVMCNGTIKEIIKSGAVDTETFTAKLIPSEIFAPRRKEDIDVIMNGFDVERLHFVSTDGITGVIRQSILDMDEETYELYVKYHLTVCERPDLVGFASHTLDVFKKL